MQVTSEHGKLTIALPERIDGANAENVKKDIQEAMSKEEYGTLCFDAGALSYISSAGLRVLLSLQKECGRPARVENVSDSVYEIFDVTGFTDIFTVLKKPKELSIAGCRIIGRGTFGTVYRLDDERVVKVYNTDRPVSMEGIEKEKRLAREVFVKGIPTALSFDVVHTEEGYGLVFELLEANTVLDYMFSHPEKEDEMTDKICAMLRKLHSAELLGDNVASMKNMLLRMSGAAGKVFTEEEMGRFRKLIADTPERHTMIHGDFHPGNIMIDKNGELVLIDVGDMSTSHPFFEFFDMYPDFLLTDEVEYGRDVMDGRTKDYLHLASDEELSGGKDFMRAYWNRLLHTYFAGHSEEEISTFDSYFRGMGRFKQFMTVFRLPDTDPEAKKREVARAKEHFFEEFDKIPPVAQWWPKEL